MFGLATLLLKFPFLKRVGAFLTSGKFLAFIAAVVIALFVITQGISFVTKYVDREVNQRVEHTMDKNEIEGLKKQVETLKNNEKINTQVIRETKVIQQAQQAKTKKIEEKIDDDVKEGRDGYTGSIVTSVIDSL